MEPGKIQTPHKTGTSDKSALQQPSHSKGIKKKGHGILEPRSGGVVPDAGTIQHRPHLYSQVV